MTTKCFFCDNMVEDDYTPQMCCNGSGCGCKGLPVEPPMCDKCTEEIWVKISNALDSKASEKGYSE